MRPDGADPAPENVDHPVAELVDYRIHTSQGFGDRLRKRIDAHERNRHIGEFTLRAVPEVLGAYGLALLALVVTRGRKERG